MYNIFFTTADIIVVCKKGYFKGILESKGITDEKTRLWVELLIPKAKRVIVNTLSFYLYTPIKIIYNYKPGCLYKYFHPQISNNDKDHIEKFNEECGKERVYFNNLINSFVKVMFGMYCLLNLVRWY
jgi:hypothetical protein